MNPLRILVRTSKEELLNGPNTDLDHRLSTVDGPVRFRLKPRGDSLRLENRTRRPSLLRPRCLPRSPAALPSALGQGDPSSLRLARTPSGSRTSRGRQRRAAWAPGRKPSGWPRTRPASGRRPSYLPWREDPARAGQTRPTARGSAEQTVTRTTGLVASRTSASGEAVALAALSLMPRSRHLGIIETRAGGKGIPPQSPDTPLKIPSSPARKVS